MVADQKERMADNPWQQRDNYTESPDVTILAPFYSDSTIADLYQINMI